MRIVQFNSIDALRASAAAWDDLWRRSDSAMPLLCAESVALYVEHVSPRQRFVALGVEREGRLVAGIALLEGRHFKFLRSATMAANPWFPAAEVLIDRAAATAEDLDALVRAIIELGWPLAWFEPVRLASPSWRDLTKAFERAGLPMIEVEGCRVGIVDMARDWESCQAGWTRNHRQQLRKKWRRLAAQGEPRLIVYDRFTVEEIESILRRCFEIERRSWKGERGMTVLDEPGALDFFVLQAKQLAVRGNLELALLEHRGQPIAFHYAMVAKGTYTLLKIGYDEEYASYSPGQMLMQCLLERWHTERIARRIDFVGLLSEATSKWATGSYTLGRTVVALGPRSGRLAFGLYKNVRPLVRAVRQRFRPANDFGAAASLTIEPKAQYETIDVAAPGACFPPLDADTVEMDHLPASR